MRTLLRRPLASHPSYAESLKTSFKVEFEYSHSLPCQVFCRNLHISSYDRCASSYRPNYQPAPPLQTSLPKLSLNDGMNLNCYLHDTGTLLLHYRLKVERRDRKYSPFPSQLDKNKA